MYLPTLPFAAQPGRLQAAPSSTTPAARLAVLAVLALTACATPLSVAPGTPEAQVRERFGPPSAEYRLAEAAGGSRLEYDTGRTGQRTYLVDFGADGRALRAWQPLTREHFARIRAGVDTQDSVRREFGRPKRVRSSLRLGADHAVWEYPYLEAEVWNSLMTITFDPKGVVQSVENGQDPWLILNK
jgi:hypothetical protein